MISDRSAGNMIAVVTIMIAAAVASTFGPLGQSASALRHANADLLTLASHSPLEAPQSTRD